MSLLESFEQRGGTQPWVADAQKCVPEDIVDIADQISVIRNLGEHADIADRIQQAVTPVVLSRLVEGRMAPQLAELYFETIPGYREAQ